MCGTYIVIVVNEVNISNWGKRYTHRCIWHLLHLKVSSHVFQTLHAGIQSINVVKELGHANNTSEDRHQPALNSNRIVRHNSVFIFVRVIQGWHGICMSASNTLKYCGMASYISAILVPFTKTIQYCGATTIFATLLVK